MTPKILEEAKLTPRFKITLEGTTVWFSSRCYDIGEGRIATVAYVKYKDKKTGEDKIVARSYYQSNSQGVWRYLAGYTLDSQGDIDWFGKGHGEESVTLPIQAQEAMAKIESQYGAFGGIPNPMLIFAGTAWDLDKKKIEPVNMNITHYIEVDQIPIKPEGNFYSDSHGKKIKPEEMEFTNPQDKPDFSKGPIREFDLISDMYKDMKIEVYKSHNNKYSFMFCRDNRNRVWLGGMEVDAPFSSTGMREKWVNAGDLATPSYEYSIPGANYTGGFGNDADRKGPYTDMFKNYLSKIPIIQEYYKARGIETPK